MAVGARRAWRRLGRLLGETLVAFLGLSSSFLGWIPSLTGLPLGAFIVGLGVVSLALGWRMSAGKAAA